MLAWYRARLASRPLMTQAVTTAFLFATGDAIAQQSIEKKGLEKHDLARTGRMAFYGGCIFGPAATTWFAFIARRINFVNRPNLTIAARVGVDQTVFAGANIACFLSTMAALEGADPKEKLKANYWQTLKSNWLLWPAVQAINFKFVPLEHRVLLVNVISLGWNCYLSYITNQPK